MFIEKRVIPEEEERYEYPYCIARLQTWFITTKMGDFRVHYLHDRFMLEEVDNANSLHAFNRFKKYAI